MYVPIVYGFLPEINVFVLNSTALLLITLTSEKNKMYLLHVLSTVASFASLDK